MPRSWPSATRKIARQPRLSRRRLRHAAAPATTWPTDLRRRLTATIDRDDLRDGLHEFITECLADISALGQQIETDYRFYRVTAMRLKISPRHHLSLRRAGAATALQQLRLTPKSHGRPDGAGLGDRRSTGGATRAGVQRPPPQPRGAGQLRRRGQTEIVIHSQGEVETTETDGVIGAHAASRRSGSSCGTTAADPTPGRGVRAPGAGRSTGAGRTRSPGCTRCRRRITRAVPYETGRPTHATRPPRRRSTAGTASARTTPISSSPPPAQLGFPARYVCGYLMMDDRVDQDASHAWAEVMSTRWAGSGSTSPTASRPDERYVRVATGLDYREAAPVSGAARRRRRRGDLSVAIQVQQQ